LQSAKRIAKSRAAKEEERKLQGAAAPKLWLLWLCGARVQ
jgi:hypothetical protein